METLNRTVSNSAQNTNVLRYQLDTVFTLNVQGGLLNSVLWSQCSVWKSLN